MDQELAKIAKQDGYGYKTANLVLLTELSKATENKRYVFEVPTFCGISSNFMQEFIKTALNKDLAKEWKELIKKTGLDNKETVKIALETKNFPDGFLAGAATIEEGIKNGFDEFIKTNSKDLQTLFAEVKTASIDTQQLKKLMIEIADKKEKLMVRSTGNEDTAELANAGGNESVANVGLDTAQLLTAIRIVICSYFSQKSLTQRLGAGDRSIPEPPFTPVLLQRMVGEKTGGVIPRSGVMFTEEPEGSLSKKNIVGPGGKVATSGIMIVQGAYGHNEGVVNSIVPVDTYYCISDQQSYAIIRPKLFRLAPTQPLKLGRRENSPALITQPAFGPAALKALKQYADTLEDYYKKPMDVEFVIFEEPANKTSHIYIVQARPIVHNKTQPLPSHLNFNNKKVGSMPFLPIFAIGYGGGELKFITDNNQVIVKKTIGAALDDYLERSDKNNVKAILVQEDACETSHEATAFRSELKPVICVGDNFSVIEQWIKSEPVGLIIDTQQQRMVKWEGDDELTLDNFKANDLAMDGWIAYPMALQLSVYGVVSGNELKTLKNNLKAILTSEQDTEFEKQLTEYNKNPIHFLHQKLAIIKTGDISEAKQALKFLLVPVSRIYNSSLKENTAYRHRIEKLFVYILQVCSQLIPQLTVSPADEANYLSKRLFPIHILETLLFQDHSDHDGLYGDSVIKIWRQMHEEAKSAKALTSKEDFTKLLGILGNYALTDQLRNNWKQFITDLGTQGLPWAVLEQKTRELKRISLLVNAAKNVNAPEKSAAQLAFTKLTDQLKKIEAELGTKANKQKIDFYNTIKTLNRLSIMELWLHTSFAEHPVSSDVDFLNREVADAKNFLGLLLSYKESLNTAAITGIANPTTFIATWSEFKKNVLTKFLSQDFITGFSKTNRLGKLAGIRIMELFIRNFDLMIKTVTGSNLFTVTSLPAQKSFAAVKNSNDLLTEQIRNKHDKIFTFHLMLEDYLLLLQKWISLSSFQDSFSSIVTTYADSQLAKLEKMTNKPAQLEAKDFNVATVVIGGSALWERQKDLIDTHEKMFMWIHQNLESVMANLLKPIGIHEQEFPQEFRTINTKFRDARFKVVVNNAKMTQQADLIGMQLDSQNLILTYNLPQRNHSAFIKLNYHIRRGETSIKFNLFGEPHANRWQLCGDFVVVKSSELAIPQTTSTTTDGLEVSWMIKKEAPPQTTKAIIEIIRTCCSAADFGNNPASILSPALSLTAKSINTFAQLDRIYYGLSDALLKAIKKPNSDTAPSVSILLKKMLEPGGAYAHNSNRALSYLGLTSSPKKYFNEHIINWIFDENLGSKLTKEQVAILLQNQEYLLDTLGNNLDDIPFLENSDKRALLTHAYYGLKNREWDSKLEDFAPFKEKELATFVLSRNTNIFSTDHAPELFISALKSMDKNQRTTFFATLARALDHRDNDIRKEAYYLFGHMIEKPDEFGISSSEEVEQCSLVVDRALKNQDPNVQAPAIALIERLVAAKPIMATMPLAKRILSPNASSIAQFYINKMATAKYSNNLEKLLKTISNLIALGLYKDQEVALKKQVAETYANNNARLVLANLQYPEKVTPILLTNLEQTYKNFPPQAPIIKTINSALLEKYITERQTSVFQFQKQMEDNFGLVKKLEYRDINRFVTIVVDAIKKESRIDDMRKLYEGVFSNISSPIEAPYLLLGYLIWLQLGDYQTIESIKISTPEAGSNNYWLQARYIYLLKKFIEKHKAEKLPTITFEEDPFDVYVEQLFNTEFLEQKAKESYGIIEEFAERAAEVLAATNNFDKFKTLLPPPNKNTNAVLLKEPVDLLRYLILAYTRRFGEIPSAEVPKTNLKNTCTELLKDFHKKIDKNTLTITFKK